MRGGAGPAADRPPRQHAAVLHRRRRRGRSQALPVPRLHAPERRDRRRDARRPLLGVLRLLLLLLLRRRRRRLALLRLLLRRRWRAQRSLLLARLVLQGLQRVACADRRSERRRCRRRGGAADGRGDGGGVRAPGGVAAGVVLVVVLVALLQLHQRRAELVKGQHAVAVDVQRPALAHKGGARRGALGAVAGPPASSPCLPARCVGCCGTVCARRAHAAALPAI